MADEAIGFSIEIPDSVFSKLDKVDEKIKSLDATAKETAKAIKSHFADIALGVDPLLNKLNSADTLLRNLYSSGLANNIQNTGNSLKGVSSDAERMTSAMVRASEAINRLGEGKNIADLKRDINDITAALEKGKGADTLLEQQQLVDTRKILKEELKAQSESTQEKEKQIQKQSDLEEKRYNKWLETKDKEVRKQEESEIKKYNSVKESIAKQNAEYEKQQQKLQELYNRQNQLAKESASNKGFNETVKVWEEGFKRYEEAQNAIMAKKKEEARVVNEATKANIEAYKNEQNQLRKNISETEKMYAQLFDQIQQSETKKRQSTYTGALSMEDNTINQRISKIQALKKVRDDLSKTDADYEKKLKTLNDAIRKNVEENNKATNSVRNLADSHRSVLNTADQLTRKLALLFSVSQIQGYLDNLIQVRGEFELQNKSLQVILQNKEEADRLFAQITELAVKSPFTLKELVTYTKQLAAYRIESENLYDTTKMLADISAGLGVSMDRLILAYGQVKAANYLRGSELRQFSEAGVNILGELADYFTQLEGHVVSVGEVFERVTKRMVTFQDVDTIFKKMTSEGGIFFKMQEQQAETLAGQLSNLRDSLDIMFNEIGAANDGVIKRMVSAVRSVVENWEALAVVLKTVSTVMVVYAAKVLAASVANNLFAKSGAAVAASMVNIEKSKGLAGFFDKITLSIKSLTASIKANPFMVIATAVTAAGYALYEYNNKVEEAKATYDTLTNVLNRNEKQLNDLVSKYNQTSTSISELQNKISGLKKGSEEYKNAQEELTKVQIENSNVLNKVKKDFPEVYNAMIENKGGVEGLAEAQKEYNEQLERTRTLNILMQSRESWFNEGINKDLSDLLETNDKYNSSLEKMKATYGAVVVEAQKAAKLGDALSEGYGKAVIEISKGSGTIEEKMNKIVKALSYASTSGGAGLKMYNMTSDAISEISKAERELTKDTKKAQNEVLALIDNVKAQSGVSTKEEFQALDEESRKSAVSFAKSFIDQIPSIKNKFIQDFINQQFKVQLGVEFTFGGSVAHELTGIQKQIDDYIKNNKLEIETIRYDQSTSDYFDSLRKDLKDLRSEEEKLKKATEQRQESQTNKQKLAEIQSQSKDIEKILRAYGEYEDKPKKKSNKIWTDRINLIQKAGKEYEKFLKYYSSDEATDKVRANFQDAFNDLQIGDILATMTFDTNGVIAALEQIGKDGGQKVSKEVNKSIASLKTEAEIELKVKGIDEIKNQVDRMFDQYDFFKELSNLNIGKELGEQIFNVEALDLNELEAGIKSYKDSLGNLGTEQLKIFENAEKKITEMQNKEREDRLKTYVQYLKKSVSERVKIEMDAQRQIGEVQKETAFTDDQKNTIIDKIKEDTQKALSSLKWDDFKGNDMYISLFEDLERTSTTAIEVMLNKLQELRSSLGNLDPSDLKDITSQIQKLQEELESRNPFKNLVSNIKEYIEYLKEKNDLESQYTSSVERESSLQEEIDLQSKTVALYEQEYNEAVKKYGVDSKQANLAETKLIIAKKNLSVAEEEYNSQKKITSEYQKQLSEGNKLGSQIVNDFNTASDLVNDINSAITDVSSGLENIFGTMSDGLKDALDSTQEILSGVAQTIDGASQLAAGIVSQNPIMIIKGALGTISGLAKTIGSIFNIGDKKKEREIQRQIESVEKLDKAYQNLKESIEAAFSISTLESSTRKVQENLQAQIESYERMIALENDKKKTDEDKIKEWGNTVDDLRAEQEKLNEDFLNEVGGFGSEIDFKNQAQAFADAWYEAFMETGDGISGLRDTFDEMLDNILKKQIMLKATDAFLKPLLDQVNSVFESANFGNYLESIKNGTDSAFDGANLTLEELEAIRDKAQEVFPEMNEFLKQLMESLNISPEKQEGETAELSGLSKGIQSVTEETAQALESLLNSMRFFVADSNTQLKSIYAALTSQDALQNPILSEMKMQTALMQSLNNMFSSVIKSGHPTLGGSFIKVSM